MMNRVYSIALILTLFSACRSVQSVSLTQIPNQRDLPVQAAASRLIFFGFNFDNDYVDSVVTQLKAACPKGTIRGILTKDEVIWYFPPFLHKREVSAQGYCLQSAKQLTDLGGDTPL